MADNEKLLEAAWIIQEHCDKIEDGMPCCFAIKGICNGRGSNCCIGNRDLLPAGWIMPKPKRWTDSDIALAKALIAFGVTKVHKETNGSGVTFDCDAIYSCCHVLPLGAFSDMKPGETVKLSDIIVEGENK